MEERRNRYALETTFQKREWHPLTTMVIARIRGHAPEERKCHIAGQQQKAGPTLVLASVLAGKRKPRKRLRSWGTALELHLSGGYIVLSVARRVRRGRCSASASDRVQCRVRPLRRQLRYNSGCKHGTPVTRELGAGCEGGVDDALGK